MTVIIGGGFSSVSVDVLKSAVMSKGDTIYRRLSEMAVGSALYSGGFGRLPHDLVGGIVGISDRGDQYPELYLELDGRLRPRQFGSSVLNSAIGHCSIVFNLRGPQLQLTEFEESFSYGIKLAKQQLSQGRADLMVMLSYRDDDQEAMAAVLVANGLERGMQRFRTFHEEEG